MSKELIFLIPLVKKVGNEILKIYNSDFSHELKNDNSPLTKADLIANDILVKNLKKEFNYDIISEESIHEIKDINSKIWVIDPIDGTRDFIKKTGEFSIQIGLIENGRPILGIVYAPALKKLYYAEKNNGSYLDFEGEIKKINILKKDVIGDYIQLISRNHFSYLDKKISKKLKISKFEKIGSIGIKFGFIAQGLADISYYSTPEMGVWDGCAPEIILTEAGGQVFDINGDNILYNCKSRKMKNGIIGISNLDKKEEILQVFKSILK